MIKIENDESANSHSFLSVKRLKNQELSSKIIQNNWIISNEQNSTKSNQTITDSQPSMICLSCKNFFKFGISNKISVDQDKYCLKCLESNSKIDDKKEKKEAVPIIEKKVKNIEKNTKEEKKITEYFPKSSTLKSIPIAQQNTQNSNTNSNLKEKSQINNKKQTTVYIEDEKETNKNRFILTNEFIIFIQKHLESLMIEFLRSRIQRRLETEYSSIDNDFESKDKSNESQEKSITSVNTGTIEKSKSPSIKEKYYHDKETKSISNQSESILTKSKDLISQVLTNNLFIDDRNDSSLSEKGNKSYQNKKKTNTSKKKIFEVIKMNTQKETQNSMKIKNKEVEDDIIILIENYEE